MIRYWLQIAAWVELAVCWIAWSMAFIQPYLRARNKKKYARIPSSRTGIFLNFLGFACVCAWLRPAGYQKSLLELIASMIISPLPVFLAWKATRHLGKQWRYEAAVSPDQELITTGPYASMRHPIYASMLALMLATGMAYTWWPLLIPGLILFVIGIEIRVRAEDRLLEQFFQDEFLEYRARVPASFLPFRR
jgi:protein-S-isoprenylcysteine O-methyltransferase Ste14